MNCNSILGIATFFAVLLGPMLAVFITRWIDNQRAEKGRQLDIFRTLMQTRKMPLTREHVGALNLVEVEFRKHPDVVTSWKNYLNSLQTPLPDASDDNNETQSVINERDKLLTKLIYEIANVVGIRVEQLEILEGNYVPQGWHDDLWEQKMILQGLRNVLFRKVPIPFELHQPENPQSPYPPQPGK